MRSSLYSVFSSPSKGERSLTACGAVGVLAVMGYVVGMGLSLMRAVDASSDYNDCLAANGTQSQGRRLINTYSPAGGEAHPCEQPCEAQCDLASEAGGLLFGLTYLGVLAVSIVMIGPTVQRKVAQALEMKQLHGNASSRDEEKLFAKVPQASYNGRGEDDSAGEPNTGLSAV